METRLTEVADGIYQLTTELEAIDFAVNQYLLAGEEPLLFHTGTRRIYPLVSQAIAEVLSIESLRWIGFGHVEADERGAKDNLLAVAPASTVVEGTLGCMVTIGDMASRPPRPVARGDKLDIGGHCVEWIDTRHVPHAWEAGVLYDHTTKVLLCGDLFNRTGPHPLSPPTTSSRQPLRQRTAMSEPNPARLPMDRTHR